MSRAAIHASAAQTLARTTALRTAARCVAMGISVDEKRASSGGLVEGRATPGDERASLCSERYQRARGAQARPASMAAERSGRPAQSAPLNPPGEWRWPRFADRRLAGRTRDRETRR